MEKKKTLLTSLLLLIISFQLIISIVFGIVIPTSTKSETLIPPSSSISTSSSDEYYGGRIFLADGPLTINMWGGVKTADQLCEEQGEIIDPKSDSWAAILVDEGTNPTRRATVQPNKGDGQIDWVFFPNSIYYQIDNITVIGKTDSNGFLIFNLSNTISNTTNNNCALPATGLNNDWTTSTGNTCGNWKRESSSSFQRVGNSCDLTSKSISNNDISCLNQARVLCVSPNAKRNTNTNTTSSPSPSCTIGMCAIQSNETACESTCGCMWNSTVPPPLPGVCMCDHRADGDPGCQYQYQTPTNSSIIELAQSGLISKDERIIFFGDSITELPGYIGLITNILNSYNVTPQIFNRGKSGATIKNIRDGYNGQPDFDTVLKQDNPTLVTIMIGINDVWHPPSNVTSTVDEFRAILTDLVERVQRFGAKIAISTVSVIGEQINGQNGLDDELLAFADAARNVSRITGAALSDVHADYLLYEQLNNVYPPGVGLYSGVLTVDGVHPCQTNENCPLDSSGNIMLANSICKGLIQALKQ